MRGSLPAMRLRREGLHWTRSGQQIVVLDLAGSEYLALNRSGSLLWEGLAERERSSDELTDLLVDRFGLNREGAGRDVAAFLETLRAHELIEG